MSSRWGNQPIFLDEHAQAQADFMSTINLTSNHASTFTVASACLRIALTSLQDQCFMAMREMPPFSLRGNIECESQP